MQSSGGSIRLRPVERKDLELWRDWINRDEIMAGLDRALPVTQAEHERFFERNVVGNDRAVWFAIEAVDSADFIGIIWLWDVDWRHRRGEVRVFIGEPTSAGKHYGRAAIDAASTFAFRTLGLHKLYAYVHARNGRSRAAFESAGFRLEATLEKEAFWDGGFFDVWRVCRLSSS
ncbi:MAG: GNAT family N-acetyltransferase [Candidatus Eremiobacteraeota bacterium]|nr:GNAT family N-acetyltransferase [Candidatus Eremiobacteraeota bacterium]